jgi:hypothetical protein
VEDLLHPLRQVTGHHRLRDPVSDGGHRQHPGATPALGDRHRFDVRWEVCARGHPIPDLVQVVLQVLLERLDRHSVHPGRALVSSHLHPGVPHLLLGDVERLGRRFQLVHPAPPGELPVDRTNQSRTTRPLRSTPITGASPLLRAGPPARRATVLSTRPEGFRTGFSLSPRPLSQGSIATRLPTFHAEAADRARAAFMPDTAWPISGHPPGLSRNPVDTPVSMSPTTYDTSSAVHSRSPSRSPPDA